MSQKVRDHRAGGTALQFIALWLGHEDIQTTQQIYLHADMALKERALAAANPPGENGPIRRYRPPDSLMAFIASL